MQVESKEKILVNQMNIFLAQQFLLNFHPFTPFSTFCHTFIPLRCTILCDRTLRTLSSCSNTCRAHRLSSLGGSFGSSCTQCRDRSTSNRCNKNPTSSSVVFFTELLCNRYIQENIESRIIINSIKIREGKEGSQKVMVNKKL